MDYIDPNQMRLQPPGPGSYGGGYGGWGGGGMSTAGPVPDSKMYAGGTPGGFSEGGGMMGSRPRFYAGGTPGFNEGAGMGSMPTGGFMGGQSGYPTRIPMSGAPGGNYVAGGSRNFIESGGYGGSTPTGGLMSGGAAQPALTQNYRDYSGSGPQYNYSPQDLVPLSYYNYGLGTQVSGNVPSYDAWMKQQAAADPNARNPYYSVGNEDDSRGGYSTAMSLGLMSPQQFNANIDRNRPSSGWLDKAAGGIIDAAAGGLPVTEGMNAALGAPQAPHYANTSPTPGSGAIPRASDGGSAGLGGLLGGGLELAGANEQLKAYEEAQRNAQAAGQFQPYNIFSGTGSTTMGPGGLTSTLSPQYQGLRDQYLGNAAAGAGAAGSFDPNQMSNQMYAQLQAQAAPGEAEQRANAVAQLQGMGQLGLGVGADTGNGPANPLYSSLLKAQADASRQRQISSYGMSQDMANQMQQRALGWGGAGLGLDQSQLGQQQLSGYLGGLSSNAALGGARLAQGPILAQGMTKGGLLSGLGSGLMGGANSGIPGWLRQQFPGVFGSGGGNPLGYNEDPLSGVDQYGSPIDAGFPTDFDSGVDWSNLYG